MSTRERRRNDACPCGSGRKYKHCCLATAQAENSARLRWRAVEGRVVPLLLDYALDRWGREFIEQAWNEFFVWEDVPEITPSHPDFDSPFIPWFAFHYVPDPNRENASTTQDWPEEPVGRHYLLGPGESLDAAGRRFIDRACDSPFSFFAIDSSLPGRAFDMTDVLTGRQFHVLEQAASRVVAPGGIVFTSVLSFEDATIQLGIAPELLPPIWRTTIVDEREAWALRRLLTLADLREYNIEIRDLYHSIAEAIRNPSPPVVVNTDGDLLEPTTLVFTLRSDPASVTERLKTLAPAGMEEDAITDVRCDADERLQAATVAWFKRGGKKASVDTTLLGTIRVEPGRLTAEVNSKKRARRLKKEIARLLGDDALLTSEKVADLASLLETSEEPPGPSPAMREAQAQAVARQWDAWPETRIPALANRTPRQAARSRAGRERLEALLADYEWRNAQQRDPALRVDVAALRRKLRI